MAKIQWVKTNFKGVEYYSHDSRKHGVRYDRYYRLRFGGAGQMRVTGLGWASEGWTEEKAALKLRVFKENLIRGEGPTTLKEEQALEREQNAQAKADAERAAEAQRLEVEKAMRENVTVTEFWTEHYFPQCKRDKAEVTAKTEEHLFTQWIQPTLGEMPLRDVRRGDVERLKDAVLDAPPLVKSKNLDPETVAQKPRGRSPRTCEYVLVVCRQIFNRAAELGIYDGKNPVLAVSKPKVCNERKRFLTHAEAADLLAAVKDHSEQLHDICLLSLRAGLRAGEIFRLAWADVDFSRGTLLIRDTKSGKDRAAYMTPEIKDMLKRQPRSGGNGSELIFKDKKGGKIKEISSTFDRVIVRLGWNDGLEDRRHKVCFHSLRHSFASQLVEGGTNLHVVRELLGHSTLRMTERYSHVSAGLARRAVQGLDAAARAAEAGAKVLPFQDRAAAEGE